MGGDNDALLATFGSARSQDTADGTGPPPVAASSGTAEGSADAQRGAPEATTTGTAPEAESSGAVERAGWLPGLDEQGRVVDWPWHTPAEPPLAHASADLAQMLHNAVAVLDTLLGALPSAHASILHEMACLCPALVSVRKPSLCCRECRKRLRCPCQITICLALHFLQSIAHGNS
jgi:hypothetical protein